ncbi:MAG: 4Fe-4S binding protein [Vicingaceae bacterium]
MKAIRISGIFLFFTALLILFGSLSLNSYQLTEASFVKSIRSEHHESLKPALDQMKGMVFTSKIAFINRFGSYVDKVNERAKEREDWNSVIWDDYTFAVVKNSSLGMIPDHSWTFFIITFLLAALGGLMYIIPVYFTELPGIKNDGVFFSKTKNKGWIGIGLGVLLIGFYIALYKFPEFISNWVLILDPMSRWLSGQDADQWFLYGFIYSLSMTIMGVRMMLKYRGNMYQQVRTLSVLFFQLCFAFTLPQILKLLNKPAYDLKSIWPLEYTFFFDYRIDEHIAAGNFGLWLFAWGVLLFVLGVPTLTYFFGKRWYCSWVCGCGGLAETVGDPFRQLSDKSLKAWKIERILVHSVLVYSVVMTASVIYSYISGSYEILGISTYAIREQYGFLIGFAFAGVVGTGFYPLMGNRMWCRFGCPLAAYLGIVQRFKSRFRITTNGGQCISCGNCSTYCEMGIDVRWYAQRGQDIVRSSCVGCGVCSAVCPRGVLKLENGPEEGRINDNPILIGSESIELNA